MRRAEDVRDGVNHIPRGLGPSGFVYFRLLVFPEGSGETLTSYKQGSIMITSPFCKDHSGHNINN